jgi:hypothetical protein
VRLVGLAHDAAGPDGEGRMPSPAVAAAVRHVAVLAQPVPARRELGEAIDRRRRQRRAHRRRLDEGEAVGVELLGGRTS